MGKVATSPLPSRGSPPLQSGGKIRSGPQMGKVATSALPSRGSPSLQSGEVNQKWPTSGQNGYVTPAVSGIPTASERGRKSEVAHKWAKWLRHPCRLGDPHRLRAGGKIRSGPQVGKVATSPLPSRGSPPLQSGGKIRSGPQMGQVATSALPSRGSPSLQSREVNQKWPTSGQSGYVTPRRLGDPHRFRARGKIRSGPQVSKVATSPLPSRGSPALQSEEENQKWPSSGQSGYVTSAVSGIPTASEQRGGIRGGPLMGKVATSPLPSRGSPPLKSGGQNQKWPTSGKVATSPLPSRRSPPLQSGGPNRKWPTSGKVATSPLPSRGSPPLQSGGQSKKWPSSGQSGYVTPAVSGIPTASERGAKSEVAHKWAKWLRHPCRLGDPHRCRAGK